MALIPSDLFMFVCCQVPGCVPGHPVCHAGVCLRAEAAQPAARVCVDDAQSRAWLACGGNTCLLPPGACAARGYVISRGVYMEFKAEP